MAQLGDNDFTRIVKKNIPYGVELLEIRDNIFIFEYSCQFKFTVEFFVDEIKYSISDESHTPDNKIISITKLRKHWDNLYDGFMRMNDQLEKAILECYQKMYGNNRIIKEIKFK